MNELITIENLRKNFGESLALRDVSFKVFAGELTVIVGPSGCGKSTLLRCINGLELFDSGCVRVGDTVLNRTEKLTARELSTQLRHLRERVGMVFQSFNLFPHLTVLENVAKAPIVVKRMSREAAERRAKELLAKVGLSDRLRHYPLQLSGGQQQRTAIARALAMSPEVMLYDEPTSALDPTLVNEVLQILRDLHGEGMTQLVVTHEMRFARDIADKVIFLHQGEVVESAHPDIIFTSPNDERTREFLRGHL